MFLTHKLLLKDRQSLTVLNESIETMCKHSLDVQERIASLRALAQVSSKVA